MAYTTIDKPTDYFNTVTWTGDGSSSRNITGVGFQPDWVWVKCRNAAVSHANYDSVRGASKLLNMNLTSVEGTNAAVNAFISDGFTVNSDSYVNVSSNTYVGWNWIAGSTAPAITYTVKVVSDSGNKYRFDDFGTSAVTLDLQEGGTYTFDQSDSSNSGHPLRFSTTSDGTHGGGSEYTTNVTTTGTPGSAGAKTVITVASSAPTLYYYCTQHSGMGGQANTNSTFGSSNFSGNIQATVSASTDAGFSIVKWAGDSSASATVGHGLGTTPACIICKEINGTDYWHMFHQSLTTNYNLFPVVTLAETNPSDGTLANVGSSTFGFQGSINVVAVNESGKNNIAYCFVEKKGYSKFGSYTGNGNADGAFVYTGFKPAFIITKSSSTGGTYYNWGIWDTARSPSNVNNKILAANTNDDESNPSNLGANQNIDFLSNGFKHRSADVVNNQSGVTYIYMAFAENPFVTSTGIPATAR